MSIEKLMNIASVGSCIILISVIVVATVSIVKNDSDKRESGSCCICGSADGGVLIDSIDWGVEKRKCQPVIDENAVIIWL